MAIYSIVGPNICQVSVCVSIWLFACPVVNTYFYANLQSDVSVKEDCRVASYLLIYNIQKQKTKKYHLHQTIKIY